MASISTATILSYAVITTFALLVPLAILAGRFAVKRQRQRFLKDLLGTLQATTDTNVALLPAFEYALHKYDLVDEVPVTVIRGEMAYFSWTALIFAVLSWAGFAFTLLYATSSAWHGDGLFLFGGFAAGGDANAYSRISAGVLVFAFLGSYVWSINYLIGRISNFDLSPVSFLRVSGRIILACVTALALRHIFGVDGVGGGASAIPEAMVLIFAFLIGFYPTAGVEYLVQKVPQLRLKRLDAETAAAARSVPVDIIDGIDPGVSFRLAEREVVEVQNLATENPILLCAETPYTPLEVLDWIAQAQLALEVGPRAYKELRDIGLRSPFALAEVAPDSELEQRVLAIVYGNSAPRPTSIEALLNPIKANIHVARLWQVHSILSKAYALGTQPVLPVAPARQPAPIGGQRPAIVDVEHTTPPRLLPDSNGPGRAEPDLTTSR